MSIYLCINSKSRELSRVKGLIDYVFDESKTMLKYCHTLGVGKQSAVEDMLFIKNLYRHTEGRQMLHWVLSFDEGVSAEVADTVGMEVLHFLAGKYQAVCATHTNTNNVHVHYAINTVDLETGNKFSGSTKDMLKFRGRINECLIKFNLKKIGSVCEIAEAKWDEQERLNPCDAFDERPVLPLVFTEMNDNDCWTGNGIWDNGQLYVPGILRKTPLIRGVTYDDGTFTVRKTIDGENCVGHGAVENGKVLEPGILYAETSENEGGDQNEN